MIQCLYLIFSLSIVILYVGLILYILKQWINTKPLTVEKSRQGFSYSIIIPARNEEKNIGACVHSILNNKGFNQFRTEVIVVDDHSTDNTIGCISDIAHPSIIVLHLEDYLKGRKSNSYKKEAINYALENATGDYIIQTDADCVFSSNYLVTLDKILQEHKPEFIACPVHLHPAHSLLEHFQLLDMIGMMGLTQAGISTNKWHMANGANMVYKNQDGKLKDLSIASGDDIHRIESMVQYSSNKILFAKDKNLLVQTKPLSTITAFISQRIRWGTKNRNSRNSIMKLISVIVYLNVMSILIHPLMFFNLGPLALIIFVSHLMFKMSVDYIYLKELSDFFNSRQSLKYFIPSTILTLLYISVVGTLSLFVKNYRWKGRSVK